MHFNLSAASILKQPTITLHAPSMQTATAMDQSMDPEQVQLQSEQAAEAQMFKDLAKEKVALRMPSFDGLAEADRLLGEIFVKNLLGPKLEKLDDDREADRSEATAVDNGPSSRVQSEISIQAPPRWVWSFEEDKNMSSFIAMIMATQVVAQALGNMAAKEIENRREDTIRAGQQQVAAAKDNVYASVANLAGSATFGLAGAGGVARGQNALGKSAARNNVKAARSNVEVNASAIAKRNAAAQAGARPDDLKFSDGSSVRLDHSGDEAMQSRYMHDERSAHDTQRQIAHEINTHKINAQMPLYYAVSSMAQSIGALAGASVNQEVVAHNTQADLLKNSAETHSDIASQTGQQKSNAMSLVDSLLATIGKYLADRQNAAASVLSNIKA